MPDTQRRSLKQKIVDYKDARVRNVLYKTKPFQDLRRQVTALQDYSLTLETRAKKEKRFVDELILDLQQQAQEKEIERDNYKEAADNLLNKVLEAQNDLKVSQHRIEELERDLGIEKIKSRKIKEYKSVDEDLFGKYRSGEEHTKLKVSESDKKRLKEAEQQRRDVAGNYGLTIKAINNYKRIEDEINGFRPTVYPENERPLETKNVNFGSEELRGYEEPYTDGVIEYHGNSGPLGAARAKVDFYRGGRFRINLYDTKGKLLNPPQNKEIEQSSKSRWQRFKDNLNRVCDTDTHCK